MTGDVAGAPLDPDERAELERLRDEVSMLRAQTAEPSARAPRHTLRWVVVTILLVLVALLAIVSVTSRFVRSQILDTDRYVATVTPVASDPAVQQEITNQVTTEIVTRIDLEAATTDALTTLTDASNLAENAPRVSRVLSGLAPVIAAQTESFVHDTVATFVGSQQFEDLWIQANRRAHDALVAVVTGSGDVSAVEVDTTGTVSISLAPIIDNVRTMLTDRGFTFAERIPPVDKQFVIFESPGLAKAQRAVNALDKASAILPWLGIACAAAAVAVAPRGRRVRALSLAGLAIAVGMLVLAIGILVARAVYLDDLPSDVLSPDAASAVLDTVLVPLRTSLRAVAVVGLVIAVGAYLTGGSASSLTVRRAFGRTVDVVRRPVHHHTPSSVERWARRLRVPLRCTVIGIAAVLLVFWNYPTGLVVLWIVLIVLAALLVLELLARPTRGAEVDGDPPDDADDAGIPTPGTSAVPG